ncbi:N-acetyl-gamma-glutamyl-phosphate reductase [Marinobacterium arenosum]|uniref:N-acetyl-gamma-glutamyl-phosphate reductase n=1 Tax=Marinobacterium arenosum TaxID=2862496 RepID=UPI001C964315|nr:N-acetyl-gamma-glutamyl-phosphate reductase [Marinobacterium arenosum]MBY4678305.1 N-acetyl-gamma-glutamyl-phosphate reductase [Marinobacterium arenosum]
MIKVGIVGGTGYTGVELLRILANHPQVKVEVITSRSEEGIRVADMFPNLRGHHDLAFSVPSVDTLARCDLVFFATPHGVAMSMAPELVARGVKVIDLGADFRIRDLELWSKWYGMEHTAPELAAQAVYGLPEVHREQIREAQLIACPGCYPTAAQLGFLPLIERQLIDRRRLIADCKSGVSGAGRGANVGTLLCEASESMNAYGVHGHRHLPEIKQGLSEAAGRPVNLTFVPHLTPMIRGIHATLYGVLKDPVDPGLQQLFEERYANEPFVDVMPAGSHPQTRSAKGSNMCRIAVHRPQGDDTVVVLSVIDNLVKGAAGQAVQNMNILFGFDETCGLEQVALMP